ncbi:MAG: amidohydrolase family protein [Planctomycetota bacterium]
MNRRARWRLSVLILAWIMGAVIPFAAAGEKGLLALKASKVLDGTGKCYVNGVVVIKGSKIVSVGESVALPGNCRVIDFRDQVICPGFIDLNSSLGAEGDLYEPASTVQTDLYAVDLFSTGNNDFTEALENGITTAIVAPSPQNVFSGRAVIVKTWGENRQDRTVCEQGPLVMTVAPSSFKEDRIPTSRMGAVDLMRNAFQDARSQAEQQKGASAGEALRDMDPGIHALMSGQAKGFFVADTGVDIRTCLDLVREFHLPLAIVGGIRIDEVAELFKGIDVPVIFGPFDFTTSERDLKAPCVAACHGIPMAFSSQCPQKNPALLRITAALAVASGLDRERALSALTSGAAAISGIGSRVGTLAPGMDADLAVYSDHPLNLHARLSAVYVNGCEAFASGTPNQEAQGENR